MRQAILLTTFAIAAFGFAHAETPVHAEKGQALTAGHTHLSADEQAFAAKLSDKNRGFFCDQLSAEQRSAVMTAVKQGAHADESVQLIAAAYEAQQAAVAGAESSVEAAQ